MSCDIDDGSRSWILSPVLLDFLSCICKDMFYLKINCKPGYEFKTDDDVDSDNLTPAGERDILMVDALAGWCRLGATVGPPMWRQQPALPFQDGPGF